MKRLFVLSAIVLAVPVFYTHAQVISFKSIDSVKKLAAANHKNDSLFIQNCFYIAEEFMSKNMYDSGQFWLNKIAARLPLRKPSFFNFYLSVDQSETYYYNGLMMMHLQESQRMLRIATALGDSLLLATANNFTGLAYMNIDSVSKSIRYFKDGIRYARQPPYPPQYLSASKPHHLYGNLAEAFYKLGNYDSALQSAYKGRSYALEISWPRGIAVTGNLLGLIYAALGNRDSAIYFQRMAVNTGLANEQEDVSLIAYGALATEFEKIGQQDAAMLTLKKGIDLLDATPFINQLFASQFLDDAIMLYRKMGREKLLVAAMEKKMQIHRNLAVQTDAQISTIVQSSVINETRAASLEVAEAKGKQALSNTRLIIALLALLSLGILFFLNRRYHKKQLNETEIRNRISRDLHDDIGASLSGVQLFNQLLNQQLSAQKPEQAVLLSEKINSYTREIMGRVSETAWLFKSEQKNVQALVQKVWSFANDIAMGADINFTADCDEDTERQQLGILQQKNTFLICKEAVNNALKYAGCKTISIVFFMQNKQLHIRIKDDGQGFDSNGAVKGNGLKNMTYRAAEIKGTCSIISSPGKGTQIDIAFPIAKIGYTG